MVNDKSNVFLRVGLGLLMMVLMIAGASAQPDTDHAISVPQVMVIGEIDTAAGRIELDGQTYRIDLQRDSSELSRSMGGRPLQLSELESGMQVLVSTDGTMPGDSHQPHVMGIWKPQ